MDLEFDRALARHQENQLEQYLQKNEEIDTIVEWQESPARELAECVNSLKIPYVVITWGYYTYFVFPKKYKEKIIKEFPCQTKAISKNLIEVAITLEDYINIPEDFDGNVGIALESFYEEFHDMLLFLNYEKDVNHSTSFSKDLIKNGVVKKEDIKKPDVLYKTHK